MGENTSTSERKLGSQQEKGNQETGQIITKTIRSTLPKKKGGIQLRLTLTARFRKVKL